MLEYLELIFKEINEKRHFLSIHFQFHFRNFSSHVVILILIDRFSLNQFDKLDPVLYFTN